MVKLPLSRIADVMVRGRLASCMKASRVWSAQDWGGKLAASRERGAGNIDDGKGVGAGGRLFFLFRGERLQGDGRIEKRNQEKEMGKSDTTRV